MWTKIVNLFGFWTKEQIAQQYKSKVTDTGISITFNGNLTPEEIEDAVTEALRARNARRMKVAHDYLDGNDNWKKNDNVD